MVFLVLRRSSLSCGRLSCSMHVWYLFGQINLFCFIIFFYFQGVCIKMLRGKMQIINLNRKNAMPRTIFQEAEHQYFYAKSYFCRALLWLLPRKSVLKRETTMGAQRSLLYVIWAESQVPRCLRWRRILWMCIFWVNVYWPWFETNWTRLVCCKGRDCEREVMPSE